MAYSDSEITAVGTIKANCVGLQLYLLADRFNHSCIPNVYVQTVGQNGACKVTCHARHDIAAGEEPTVNYIGYSMSREERSLELQTCWLFECSCPACKLDFEGNVLESRRKFRTDCRTKVRDAMENACNVPLPLDFLCYIRDWGERAMTGLAFEEHHVEA